VQIDFARDFGAAHLKVSGIEALED